MAFGLSGTSDENKQYNNLSGTSSTAANLGLQDLGESSGFMSSILSGDPTKIAQVLSPQIKAIQDQGQQKLQTNSQFGNRGGGTNASNQTTGDQTRSGVQNMISSLTGSAVSGLSQQGSSTLNSGMSGFGTAFSEAQAMDPWTKLMGLGNSAGEIVGGAFKGGYF